SLVSRRIEARLSHRSQIFRVPTNREVIEYLTAIERFRGKIPSRLVIRFCCQTRKAATPFVRTSCDFVALGKYRIRRDVEVDGSLKTNTGDESKARRCQT